MAGRLSAAPRPPDYTGGSLVNLAAELEHRLAGTSPAPPLHPELASLIPAAASYVLVIFDGLGDGQLGHPAARPLAAARQAALDTVFPTTTTVALASLATGRPPSQHGLLGYQLWMPEAGVVVNTLKWRSLWGDPVELDYEQVLPAPNLWERLAAAGVEPITVQPAGFAGTPLSRVLYRGCRFEPAYTMRELADAAAELAATPGRLVLAYVPHVDVAAHMDGQDSAEYAEALSAAAAVWERIVARLPSGAALIGCADHGHVDFPAADQVRIARPDHDGRTFYGDQRAMFVRGDGAVLATRLPARWEPLAGIVDWWGPPPRHPEFTARAPDGVLLASPGRILLHRFSDDGQIGHHGGLSAAERRVPLLVGPAVRPEPAG